MIKRRLLGNARWTAIALSSVSLSLSACGDAGHTSGPAVSTENPDDAGTLSLSLSGTGDLAGFRIEVSNATGPVASKFVSGASDAQFTLAPGDYQVKSTPMSSETVAAADCLASSHAATIVRGRTTELTLVSRCDAGNGELVVTPGTNFAPQLIAVQVNPGTHVAPCDHVTVEFDASDKEGDALTGDIAVSGGTPVTITRTAGAEPAIEHFSARLELATGGERTVTVRACDAQGCGSLEFPLHVSAGTCAPSCEDGNPCTTDTANPSGVFSSTPVADGSLCTGGNFHVKLLGLNDFHGQLEKGKLVSNRPVGGAAVLASYLKTAQAGIESQTIIVHAGDHVGASPPASALLQDEPSIAFLNLLANDACNSADKLNPACNIVGTLGNHEFDEGKGELLRLLMGGNHANGPFLEDPYPGARFPYVNSNVIDIASGQHLLRPFVVKELHGIKVGFIGAVLKGTPSIVTPTGVAGLDFRDEADSINEQVAALKTLGVHTVVVTIHQGGFQNSYTGPTRAASLLTSGPEILDIVKRLDDEVDVVVSGHSHAFTNAFLPNAHGKQMLVVQAFSASTAYDDIDLLVDPATGDVVSKTASIVTTFGDAGPGLRPDPVVEALVARATSKVAPLVNQVFGTSAALTRNQNAAGESALGDLIADSQLAAMHTQFAFMNPGGIRADLDAGEVTFGDLFTIQPFANTLVRLDMTGAQIVKVLEQQWLGQTAPKILQISGFDYTWNPAAPVGSRIVEVRLAGVAIDLNATYSVTCNNFLATGGDGFTGFTAGRNQIGGPVDLDAIIDYVEEHSPIGIPAGNRIQNP